MLNYRLGFCQIKKTKFLKYFGFCALIAIFSSCSSLEKENHSNKQTWGTIQARPSWFKKNSLYEFKDQEGNIYAHPFFDLVPYIDYEDLLINFFVVNGGGNLVVHQFDLNSGRKYYSHKACHRDDSWKKYKGEISTPPFTLGIVPRVLNQIGRPLEIMVFGNEEFYKQNHGTATHQARVVGGVVLQYCDLVKCHQSESELVLMLVAVDMSDPRYLDIRHLKDLKNLTDWSYFESYWGNYLAVRHDEKSSIPSYKIVNEVGPFTAFQRATTKNLILQTKELQKIRSSCLKLYKTVWEKIGVLKRKEIENQKNFGDINLKNEQLSGKFLKEFLSFYDKWGRDFLTCTQYVKSSDGLKDYNRHWFMAYIEAFFKLIDIGYVYDCNAKNWRRHLAYKTPFAESKEEIKKCSDQELDLAFPRAITFLSHLKQGQQRHYRYVEYDHVPEGTHEKLYSWVLDEGKTLKCIDGTIEPEKSIFPIDVKWTLFTHYESKRKRKGI